MGELKQLKKEKLNASVIKAQDHISPELELVSSVFHDIRTPLNVITGMANIAKKSEGDFEKTREYLDNIINASEYVTSLTNDFLDVFNICQNDKNDLKCKFTLDALITGVKDIVMLEIKKKSIDFQVERKNLSSEKYIGNFMLLKRVLINLISNATKFVDDGGKILLSIDEVSREKDQVRLSFVVEDNGIGMSREFLKNIFQPFKQEKNELGSSYKSSGLGLFICKNLLDKIDGTIAVESEKGIGSQFNVTIPLSLDHDYLKGENKLEILEVSNVLKWDYSGKRILIVEDNDLNAEIVFAILEEKNATLERARNGQEAIEMFKKSREYYFDLILMDMMMPIKNGIEATCEIRNLKRPDATEIPIIAMSADVCNNNILSTLKDKLNDSIFKPINTEQLFLKLHFWLKTS